MMRRSFFLCGLFLLAVPSLADELAISGARILTGDGKTIVGGAVLVRDGKIVRLLDAAPADGVKRQHYPGAVIIPGLVAASSMAGISGAANEESSEITPTFAVAGAIDPTSRELELAAEAGITTAYVRPGLHNVIGGFGAVIHPGERGARFFVNRRSELLVPIGPWPARGNWSPGWGGVNNPKARRPSTRLATIWLIRKSFHDAARFLRTGSTEGLEKETPGPYTRAELQVLALALQGKLLVRFYAQTDKDVRTVFRLVDEFSLKRFRIDGLVEGYRGPQRLARVEHGLIAEVHDLDPMSAGRELGLPMPVQQLTAWMKTGHEHHDACQFCPRCAAAGGVDRPAHQPRYGFRADNFSVLAAKNPKLALSTGGRVPDLLAGATLAVRHGLSRAQALAAITRIPAELLGVADRAGTLAPGKRADLVVLSGPPFEFTTRILAVYSGGKVIFPRKDN